MAATKSTKFEVTIEYDTTGKVVIDLRVCRCDGGCLSTKLSLLHRTCACGRSQTFLCYVALAFYRSTRSVRRHSMHLQMHVCLASTLEVLFSRSISAWQPPSAIVEDTAPIKDEAVRQLLQTIKNESRIFPGKTFLVITHLFSTSLRVR